MTAELRKRRFWAARIALEVHRLPQRRTKKVTKKQLAALRKQVAKANKKKGVKKKQTIKLGACKKPKKKR